MLIGVDVGNSSIKAGVLSDGQVLAKASQPTQEATERTLDAMIDVLLGAGQASGLAWVSVVDSWDDRLHRSAARLGALPLPVGAASIPMALDVREPLRTGGDRLLAAWAAMRTYGAPVIVVDLGTATTVEMVDRDGIYRGGAILPGIGLAFGSMASGTDRLPRLDAAAPEHAIGRDTSEAIRSGVVLGHLGSIRELAARMQRELGEDDVTLVACGGIVAEPWLGALLTTSGGPGLPALVDHRDTDLVLRGLWLLAADAGIVASEVEVA